MDDTKLLELAGLAAGEQYGPGNNPLERDDLALRLAVKLQLSAAFKSLPHAVYVEVGSGSASSAIETLADVRFEVSDPYAATRRAIVRAAAAIGKDMP